MGDHAKYSPSAADRWSVCTASPAIEAGLPESTSSYAEEGTAAHDLLERAILARTAPAILEPEHSGVAAVQKAYEHVEGYVNDPSVVTLAETQVRLVDDCYGTADIVVILPTGELIVIDYKHGQGVLVEADCKQLLIYGVAAWKTLGWMVEKINTITTVIIQPRAVHNDGPIRSHTRTMSEALSEADELIQVINKINRGETELVPSEKGCKFCKYAGSCPALADKALAGVLSHFEPTGLLHVEGKDVVPSLTPEQKASILEARGLFKTFLAAIEDDVEKILSAGGIIPGFKQVLGRSNRCFDKELTEEQVMDILTNELKFKVSEVAPPKLLGPAPIEKMVDVTKRNGKKKLARLQEIIVKPDGKPTVVPESDKRPAIKGYFEAPEDPLG